VLLAACSVVEDERTTEPLVDLDPATGDKTPVHLVDEGDACFYADAYPDSWFDSAEPQYFEENSRLAVTVTTPGCLSQTCDVDRVAFCEIDQDGEMLFVSSYLGFNEVDAPMCTMDCGTLTARCQSEPLSAGNYTIVHGDTREQARTGMLAALDQLDVVGVKTTASLHQRILASDEFRRGELDVTRIPGWQED